MKRTQRILGELAAQARGHSPQEGPEEAMKDLHPQEYYQNASLTDKKLTVRGVSYVRNPEAKVIGQYTAVYDRLSDGTQVLRKEKFVPVEPAPKALRDIWNKESSLTHGTFLLESIRQGLAEQDRENNRLVWNGQAVTIRVTIELLIKHGAIKDLKCWDKLYQAFTGTFYTPKVKQSRSLRANKTTWFYRQKEKQFTELLNRIYFFH